MKNYLPSKKFIYAFLICVGILLIFLLISNIFFGKSSFLNKKNKEDNLKNSQISLSNMLQKDTDEDGVMDWEEALWGTDINKKETFDIPDQEYIKNKKAELKATSGEIDNSSTQTLNETDKFAQQFFASLAAMKQNGQIDQNTINNVSATLGQNITDPTIIDKYNENNIKISKIDNDDNKTLYYNNAQKIFQKYKKVGLGTELSIITNIINEINTTNNSTNNQKSIEDLNKIAKAYESFGIDMVNTETPESLKTYHLKIINNANNINISILNMTKIIEDPVIGLSGLSQYQKYSDDLVSSVNNLEEFLLNNGIIN